MELDSECESDDDDVNNNQQERSLHQREPSESLAGCSVHRRMSLHQREPLRCVSEERTGLLLVAYPDQRELPESQGQMQLARLQQAYQSSLHRITGYQQEIRHLENSLAVYQRELMAIGERNNPDYSDAGAFIPIRTGDVFGKCLAHRIGIVVSVMFGLTDRAIEEAGAIGLDMHFGADGIATICQNSLINWTLQKVRMTYEFVCRDPMLIMPLGADPNGGSFRESWNYETTVDKLEYVSINTRPDIIAAVEQVKPYIVSPKISHGVAVTNIIKYLKGTNHEGIIIGPTTARLRLELHLQIDRVKDGSSAQLGWLIMLADTAVAWRSVKLNDVNSVQGLGEAVAVMTGLAELSRVHDVLRDVVSRLVSQEDLRLPEGSQTYGQSVIVLPDTEEWKAAAERYVAEDQDFKVEFAVTGTTEAGVLVSHASQTEFEQARERSLGW